MNELKKEKSSIGDSISQLLSKKARSVIKRGIKQDLVTEQKPGAYLC